MQKKSSFNQLILLWAAAGLLLVGLVFARAVWAEYTWLTIVDGVALLGVLGAMVGMNRKQLMHSRSAAYGLNSAVTVLLVLGIVGVANFMASRYPQKADFTKNKLHTLSDQTVKLIKGLNKDVKVVLYAGAGEREKYRPLFDNYKALSTKFTVEYVDPNREVTRAKSAGIKKMGTAQLLVGSRDNKVDDPTEEKLTNTLIKMMKEKETVLCAITGHGERSFGSNEADGYEGAKKALQGQSYEVKDVNLMQEGKVPETCDAVAILGPQHAFFEPEIKTLQAYFEGGGRAVIAADINVKGAEAAPELAKLLEPWHVKTDSALIVDPLSRMMGVDAAVPILATFSKENSITKELGGNFNCYFPFTRPLEVVPGAPAGMKVEWLAQTTPKSWGVTDMAQLASGQVTFREGKDKSGPLTAAIAVDGKQKDSKATRNTRLVVFGTSLFATNNYSRFGGNLDFFLNAASWIMEDESLISIRAKEEAPSKVELSQKAGNAILVLVVFLIPGLIAAGGITIWALRRRL
jgi:ABC-type uncharacterized transport system involved in gliding motility auxiliary subunit